jgi:hypothetical protein
MIYLAGDTGMRPGEYLALPRFNITSIEVKVDRAVERSGQKISVRRRPPEAAGRTAARSHIAHAGHGRTIGGLSIDALPFE